MSDAAPAGSPAPGDVSRSLRTSHSLYNSLPREAGPAVAAFLCQERSILRWADWQAGAAKWLELEKEMDR